jgi:hypothetical protein
MKTYTITRTVRTGSQTIQGEVTATAESSQELEVALDAAQANKEITLALVRAKILALMMVCDQAATVKINASGNPASVTLAAGVPYVYCGAVGDVPLATQFAADITALFVTNGSADTAATFKVSALVDPTP